MRKEWRERRGSGAKKGHTWANVDYFLGGGRDKGHAGRRPIAWKEPRATPRSSWSTPLGPSIHPSRCASSIRSHRLAIALGISIGMPVCCVLHHTRGPLFHIFMSNMQWVSWAYCRAPINLISPHEHTNTNSNTNTSTQACRGSFAFCLSYCDED